MNVAIVSWLAVGAAVISFAVWAFGTFQATRQAKYLAAKVATTGSSTNVDQHGFVAGPSVTDLKDLLVALSTTIDALAKAGPGLVGIGASILFLGIATWTVAPPSGKKPQVCTIPKGATAAIVDNTVKADITVVCKDPS